MIEIAYPYHLGGEMVEAYQDDDQETAQEVLNEACKSARLLERKRILELLDQLHDSFVDDYGHTPESIAVSNLIAAVKGESA